MTRETAFRGLMITAGVPATLMVLTHHATLGAATVAATVTAWMVCEVTVARAQQRRDTALLDYAQTATNLGGDPTPVISALRQRVGEEDELYRPDEEERPWVHLRASDY
jgi:hypothetical protein